MDVGALLDEVLDAGVVVALGLKDEPRLFANLGCDVGDAGGKTSPELFVARAEGRSGLGSGGWALSASVRASAAARSAARDASWGVVGGAGGACEGADGFAHLTGSIHDQYSCIITYRGIDRLAAHSLEAVEKR